MSRWLGLTQERFAERIGRGRAWVAHVERGRKNPTLRTVENLAGPLGGRPHERLVPSATEDPAGDEAGGEAGEAPAEGSGGR